MRDLGGPASTTSVEAARGVGARAAQHGAPLSEVLDRLESDHAAQDREPPFATVRAAVEAWLELTRLQHVDMSCENPLTTLSGVPHLRSRLHDLVRAGRVQDHALLVLQLPPVHDAVELEVSLRALDVADVLRQVFVADETVAQLDRGRFGVLASRSQLDPMALHSVRHLVERDLVDGDVPRLWVESLPVDADGVAALLARLVRAG